MSRQRKPDCNLNCLECGGFFNVRPWREDTAKYCSKRCKYDAQAKAQLRRAVLTCQECRREFEVHKSDTGGRKKFCSKDCANKAKRKPIELTCQGCGSLFVTTPYKAKTRRVCSRKCNGIRLRKEAIGNKTMTDLGYVSVHLPDNPMASKTGGVLEHRLVMSEVLGRPLEPHEHIHHLDGNKANNKEGNLELWILGHPKGIRISDLIEHYWPIIQKMTEEKTNEN